MYRLTKSAEETPDSPTYVEITYKEGATSETTNNNLKKMLDDYILGDILGESAWWGGIQKSKGQDAAKIFKRLKLFDKDNTIGTHFLLLLMH